MYSILQKKIWLQQVLVIVSFLGLAIIMLNANPFKGETVAPMDLLASKPGWQSLDLDIKPIHPERSDIIDSRLPKWIYIKHQIRNGQFPLWNPTRAGGALAAQSLSSSIFSPGLFAFCLFESDALGLYISHLVNILIGLCGTYLFLKLFVDSYAAYFGSIVYTFCGFNAAWFFWPHFATSIWIPWLLFFGYQCLRTMQIQYLVGLTMANVMLILGGFPMVAIFGYLALGVLMISYYWHAHRSIKVIPVEMIVMGAFLAFSFLITAPAVYSLKEMLNFTGRLAERSGGTNLQLKDLLLFINPYVYNLPRVEKTLYVGLTPLVLSTISLYFFWVKREMQSLFGLLLFIISITIAFSLLHPDLIRLIPFFSSNPWNRISILIGLALACLSAIGLGAIGKLFKNKTIYFALAILLIGVETIDLKIMFNTLNNAVPGSSFYSRTRSIEHVQRNIGPFQYLIAGNSFYSSGTLNAYGINEWFSHNLRPKRERDILSQMVTNPFRSPTMASFPARNILFSHPLMDKMNVKYVLSTAGAFRREIMRFRGVGGSEPLPPLPENDIGFTFSLEKPISIDSITLHMATYHAPHAPADVVLTLYDGVDDTGNVIERVVIPKEKVIDNGWAEFAFGTTRRLYPGSYNMKLSMTRMDVSGKLTVWAYKTEDLARTSTKNQSAYVVLNGKRIPFQFNMYFYGNVPIGDKWISHQIEKDTIILENRHVKGSAYWMPTLSLQTTASYDSVRLIDFKCNRLTFEYSNDLPGWVVIPMRNYPGWKAYVNGKTVSHSIFSDIMPAIPVDGKSKIIFKYGPSHFKKLVLLSMGSLIFLIIIFILFRRKKLIQS